MSIYQAMQVNAAGSKALIRNAENQKEKYKFMVAYALKIVLTLVFCTAVVAGFQMLFGAENSPVGVVVVLMVLTFRQADLGIQVKQGILSLLLIYGIMAIGPHLTNRLSLPGVLTVNIISILGILILGCHNIIMCNHIILLLCYFLLQGNDVTGMDYGRRVLALIAGGVITAFVFWLTHRKREYKRSLKDMFLELHLHSFRTKWYLKTAVILAVCHVVTVAFHIPRGMWVCFAAMSMLMPFEQDAVYKAHWRVPCNVIGGIAFSVLYLLLPEHMRSLLGILGGIGVGLSASYGFQTAFNAFGGLLTAAGTMGLGWAVFLRISTNTLGCVLAIGMRKLLNLAEELLERRTGLVTEHI